MTYGKTCFPLALALPPTVYVVKLTEAKRHHSRSHNSPNNTVATKRHSHYRNPMPKDRTEAMEPCHRAQPDQEDQFHHRLAKHRICPVVHKDLVAFHKGQAVPRLAQTLHANARWRTIARLEQLDHPERLDCLVCPVFLERTVFLDRMQKMCKMLDSRATSIAQPDPLAQLELQDAPVFVECADQKAIPAIQDAMAFPACLATRDQMEQQAKMANPVHLARRATIRRSKLAARDRADHPANLDPKDQLESRAKLHHPANKEHQARRDRPDSKALLAMKERREVKVQAANRARMPNTAPAQTGAEPLQAVVVEPAAALGSPVAAPLADIIVARQHASEQ